MKKTKYKEVPWDAYMVYWRKAMSIFEIVFADRASLAKSAVASHSDGGIVKTDGELTNSEPPIEYIELGTRRLPEIDGMALEPLSDIAFALIKERGWMFEMEGDNGEKWTSDDLKTDEDITRFKEWLND